MKIYTRTGDKGETSLFGGKRVPKNHPRVQAYGTLDELNSVIGIAVSLCKDKDMLAWLEDVQIQLFNVGAWLASPEASKNIQEGKSAFSGKRQGKAEMEAEDVTALETLMDQWEKELQPLKVFILPGGSHCGSQIHFARTICRRAERECVGLKELGEIVPD